MVWYTARRLHEALAGRPLTRSDFRVPRLATADLSRRRGNRDRLPRQAPADPDPQRPHRAHPSPHGRQLAGTARGRAGEGRVTGSGWYSPTTTGRLSGYQLGVVEVIRTGEEQQVTGHLGPDLLGPDWDCAEAVRRLSAEPGRPIGEALLDQRNLAGAGIYLCGRDAVPAGHRSRGGRSVRSRTWTPWSISGTGCSTPTRRGSGT